MRFVEDYWIKTFADNTQEVGTDSLIHFKKASWTNGNLENIKEVSFSFLPRIATVSLSYTEYHQFDRYSAYIEAGRVIPKRIARVIQAKISESQVGGYLLYNIRRNNAYLVMSSTKVEDSLPITKDLIGKWATIIITKQGFFFQIGLRGKVEWAQVNI